MTHRALAVLIILWLALALGCGTDPNDARTTKPVPSELTLDEVYAAMEQAIVRPGQVLHVAVVLEEYSPQPVTPVPTPEGYTGKPEDYADQLWIDGESEVIRIETRIRYFEESSDRVTRSIHKPNTRFEVDDEGRSSGGSPRDPLLCRGSDSWMLAQLMRCGNFLEESTTVVQEAEYEGERVIVLFTQGELPSHDWTFAFENSLFISASSYLPLWVERDMTGGGDNGDLDISHTSRYDLEFVPRASLAADFFDPKSFGYFQQSPVPIENMVPQVDGMVVYWLGEQFDAGREVPLPLRSAKNHTGEHPPGALFTLSYGIKNDPEHRPGVGFGQYPSDAEDQLQRGIDMYWKRASVTQTELTLNGVRVVLFKDTTDYGDRHRAQIYFPTTIVVIEDGIGAPPYLGEDLVMRAIAGLRPFE